MHTCISITDQEKGKRIDKFLADFLKSHPEIPSASRTKLQEYIKEGYVKVNDRKVAPHYVLRAQDMVIFSLDIPVETCEVIPQDIPLSILFEDAHIIVVNKDAHMVVHPAAGNADKTLVNALLYHCGHLASLGSPLRPGIVHRLDKGTSGVMVCAKTDAAYLGLVDAFKKKKVKKEYLAIVEKEVSQSFGTIDVPIGRHTTKRTQMSVQLGHSKEAVTCYEILFRSKDASVIKVSILTGRTHQIRVHMAYIGHPILGDRTYGHASKLIDRQALHAWRLSFIHPITSKALAFEAEIPLDMQKVLDYYNVNFCGNRNRPQKK